MDLTGEKDLRTNRVAECVKIEVPPLVVTKSPLSDPVSDASEESPGNATSHGIIAGSGDRKSPTDHKTMKAKCDPVTKHRALWLQQSRTRPQCYTCATQLRIVVAQKDPGRTTPWHINTYGDLDDQMPTDPSSKPKKSTVKLPTHAEFERFSFSALADFLKKLGVNSAVVAADQRRRIRWCYALRSQPF